MMFTCQEQSSYSHLHAISIILIIVVNFFTAIIHIHHYTAQMMDSERAAVFTGRCFNLFTSNA